ncbi:MAG: hypothetical protein Alpg2KO_05190 [Alphaproteobacteria bacterium]
MFDAFKAYFSQKQEEAHARRAKWEREQAAHDEDHRHDAQVEAELEKIRIITGDTHYKYALLNTLRVWGFATARPGQEVDATRSTDIAVRLLQEEAYKINADAVIHVQFHILRYDRSRDPLKYSMPCYETHAFGTAIKIIGPPDHWKEEYEAWEQTGNY